MDGDKHESSSQGSPGSFSDLYQSSEQEHDAGNMMAASSQHNEPHRHPSKRKLEEGTPFSPGKRRRFSFPSHQNFSPLSSLGSCKNLPPEIWQYIFRYLSPHSLGRLLSVNRAFLMYLTRIVQPPEGYTSSGVCKLLSSERVWSLSRKAFNPGFPRPMIDFSERDMWALAGSRPARRYCQFCRKLGESILPPRSNAWEQGPGPNGVRIIWPFGIRTCGSCLEQMCQKVRQTRESIQRNHHY